MAFHLFVRSEVGFTVSIIKKVNVNKDYGFYDEISRRTMLGIPKTARLTDN